MFDRENRQLCQFFSVNIIYTLREIFLLIIAFSSLLLIILVDLKLSCDILLHFILSMTDSQFCRVVAFVVSQNNYFWQSYLDLMSYSNFPLFLWDTIMSICGTNFKSNIFTKDLLSNIMMVKWPRTTCNVCMIDFVVWNFIICHFSEILFYVTRVLWSYAMVTRYHAEVAVAVWHRHGGMHLACLWVRYPLQ